MKKLTSCMAVMLALCMLVSSAMACSAIYVGSALTSDGTTFFARSEDLSNSRNKVMYVSPQGNHTAGEEYAGCYGFTYTFTHDSYAYTAFRDDNLDGVDFVCPNCGGTHAHTPYEAGGTNEKGVSVSATETLGGDDALLALDPYEDCGIEEAEITTVILSEAATAREGVELILSIYDNAGCNAGAGIFVADHSETWYIENVTGHQYVALRMSDCAVFSEPNMSIIGLIDLDDENVIASPDLIATAVKAGTFVGDADANVIDYRASYNASQTANARLKSALAYFNAAYQFADTEPDPALYCLTNVGEDGAIVPLHTGIELEHAYGIADVVGYYKIPGIGKTGNLETHIFQIASEHGLTDTVEWVAIDDASCNVFVPFYPMLTRDVYAACKVSTAKAAFVEEEPTEGVYYATTTTRRDAEGKRVSVPGFKVLPANWADSYYWSVDAVSNMVAYGELGEDVNSAVLSRLDDRQKEVYAAFEEMKAAVAAAETAEEMAEIATKASMDMQSGVHALMVKLMEMISRVK
ncbi:MAG: C69 family dipeptidase [bacterium]|nr:C69 family dipeptidase [bacterium]